MSSENQKPTAQQGPPPYGQATAGTNQPPQPPYPPGAPMPPTYPPNVQTQVYVTQPVNAVLTGVQLLGSSPCNMTCPHCHQNVYTTIKRKPGLLTWLLVGLLCLIGCFLGCCLIPLCIDDCQDVEHYCPRCKALIGEYKRM